MSDCIFCKIADGEIPSKKVYEDAAYFAFRDIEPQAPVHVVVIPRKHIPTLNDISATDPAEIGALLQACRLVARAENVAASGYRVVINCNRDAGQAVFHLHAHVLGGRALSSTFA
ncbi:MAG: histidine triad nucleotide-binding protein [Candidatus Abyssobacteria bacterium SURF_5]|uniref:Histidine triad nucleotide-binding protein n=1 Tax=Abyssobacteria bacterium (strain SURF_5) TaxID=2093360 RepID=A0A3A4P6P1_ABYX5|nr:MAG: histidine triad nucleotide-binding protein [Candidatus Abyssubacteria bacterium SURF_5]